MKASETIQHGLTGMNVPTEPIGSIPKSLRLIGAVTADGMVPGLDSLSDVAILKVIRENIKLGQQIFVAAIDPVDRRAETPEEVHDRVLEAAEHNPAEQRGTTDDCGGSSFCDDTTTTRDTAFAKIRTRIEGIALAATMLGGG